MAELGIAEAAAALGVSVDTIRRRVRAGTLPGRHDARGRLLVTLPDAAEPAARQPAPDAQQRLAGPEALLAGPETAETPSADSRAIPTAEEPPPSPALAHAHELLDEVRRQRDQLEAQVEAQRRQLEAAEVERAELRRLLAVAMQGRALAEPAAPAGPAEDATRPSQPPTRDAIRTRSRPPRTRLAAWVRNWLGL